MVILLIYESALDRLNDNWYLPLENHSLPNTWFNNELSVSPDVPGFESPAQRLSKAWSICYC